MIKDLNLREGQEDLRIVEHLDVQKLPESLREFAVFHSGCRCER